MTQPSILITGVCGFTGRHLLTCLARRGASVTGIDVTSTAPAAIADYHCCDLADESSLERVVSASRPVVVFHLAGLMGTAGVEQLWRVNVGGYTCLTNVLRRHAIAQRRPIRLVTIGSAAELGSVGAATLPVKEDAPCMPETAYGRSKHEITRRALAEPPDSPLEIIVARPFNLSGPGLSRQLSLGSFAAQIVAVLRGEADSVRCGPLDARRDFVDVRDAVEAYVALADRGRPRQIYNVCAGQSFRIGDLLDRLIERSGRPIPIVSQPAGRATGDIADIYGDHSKITRETLWRPTVSIDQSLTDLLAAAQEAACTRRAA